MRPPRRWNFCDSRRNSMISLSSSLASSTPATSLKVIFFCCMESRRARDLPKLMALLPPDCIWRRRKNQRPRRRAKGASWISRLEPGVGVLILDGDVDAVIAQRLIHVRVVGRDGGVELGLVIAEVSGDLGSVDDDIAYLALVRFVEQLGEADALVLTHARAFGDELPKEDEARDHENPNQNLFDGRVQVKSPFPACGRSMPIGVSGSVCDCGQTLFLPLDDGGTRRCGASGQDPGGCRNLPSLPVNEILLRRLPIPTYGL